MKPTLRQLKLELRRYEKLLRLYKLKEEKTTKGSSLGYKKYYCRFCGTTKKVPINQTKKNEYCDICQSKRNPHKYCMDEVIE